MPTNTELTTTSKPSVIRSLATRLEVDPAKLEPMLKATAFSTCRSNEEFMAMCIVANTYGLNPITKEIYAFPAKNGAVVPMVGVDGWIKLMNRNPAFDGIEFEEGQKDGDTYCTVVIYRKDRGRPIKVTEWLSECKRATEPWKQWPKRMLRNKVICQGARLAFGFAGIYDEDEAERIAEAQPAEVVAVRTSPAPKRGRRATAAEVIAADAVVEDVPDAALSPALPAPAAPAVETPPPAVTIEQPQPQAARGGDFLL